VPLWRHWRRLISSALTSLALSDLRHNTQGLVCWKAAKGFRRLKAYKQLTILKQALLGSVDIGFVPTKEREVPQEF